LGCLSVSDWRETDNDEYRGNITASEKHNTQDHCEICEGEQKDQGQDTRLADWLEDQEKKRQGGLLIAGSAFTNQS
jgi:hypothetical protein